MGGKKVAWVSSADVLWDGRLTEEFREKAGEILDSELTEDAWGDLCHVVRRYSMALSFEHGAVSPTKQRKGLSDALKACDKLIAALEYVQQPEMGTLLTTLIDDKWEELTNRRAQAARNTKAVLTDLVAKFEAEGHDPEGAEHEAWNLIHGWRSGSLQEPSPGDDLQVQLWEVRGALSVALNELTTQSETYSVTVGAGFDALVGELAEWTEKHGLRGGATKLADYNNHGPLVYLVKEIVAQVPLLRDNSGKVSEKQIRPIVGTDQTLADKVVSARVRYKATRDRLGGK